MSSIESYLDNVFQDAAQQKENSMKGKLYHYKISGMGYTAKNDNRQSGKCIVKSVTYSKDLDCDVITFTDIDSNENFSICQFEVKFEAIRKD